MPRLLLDQMLPVRLRASLANAFAEVRHVRPLGLDQATDAEVFAHAGEYGLTIVTKDADFQALLALHGTLPRVVWLRMGNATTPQMESALRRRAWAIWEFYEGRGACLVIRA